MASASDAQLALEQGFKTMGEEVVGLYGSSGKLEFDQFKWFVADVTGKTGAGTL